MAPQNLNSLDSPLEFKFVESGSGGRISGYGSKFGEVDQGADTVVAGAYAKSLKARGMPKMLFQHDPSQPLGAWVDVKEDDVGLAVEGDLCLDCRAGLEAAALIKMKAISGLSIGYRTIKSEKDQTTGVRRLIEVELWEVSVVTFPMQASAGISSIKNLDEIDGFDLSDIDYHLREAGGFSRQEAKRLLHRHAAILDQRKAEADFAVSRKAALDSLKRVLSS